MTKVPAPAVVVQTRIKETPQRLSQKSKRRESHLQLNRRKIRNSPAKLLLNYLLVLKGNEPQNLMDCLLFGFHTPVDSGDASKNSKLGNVTHNRDDVMNFQLERWIHRLECPLPNRFFLKKIVFWGWEGEQLKNRGQVDVIEKTIRRDLGWSSVLCLKQSGSNPDS